MSKRNERTDARYEKLKASQAGHRKPAGKTAAGRAKAEKPSRKGPGQEQAEKLGFRFW